MAETTERLMLQVDAATELLRRHLSDAEQPLARFERRAEKTAERVDKSIGEMGSRFGVFASLADTAAKRAEKSFEASFSQVQRIAAQAIKGPTVDARVNLGVDDLRAQAAQAQEQARSFELIGAAAERATGGTARASEATHLFIQATNASRIEAERKAAALLQEAGALERVQIELMQSADATEHFVTRHQRIEQAVDQQRQLAIATAASATEQRELAAAQQVLLGAIDPMYTAQQRFDREMTIADRLLNAGTISTRDYAAAQQLARQRLNDHAVAIPVAGQAVARLIVDQDRATSSVRGQAMAMQGLSYQAQDVMTQMSMGANIFNVFAVQGAQAAGQVSHLDNNLGKVGRFMMGGWGLGVTAVVMGLGYITKDMHLFSDATEEAIDKLKKDAVESGINAKAKERFALTLEGVTAAINDQRAATDQAMKSDKSAAEQSNENAKAQLQRMLVIRRTTAALLAQAEAEFKVSQSMLNPIGGAVQYSYAQKAGDARKAAADAVAEVRAAEIEVQRTLIGLSAESAIREFDPIAKLNKKYADQVIAVKALAEEKAKHRRLDRAALKRELEDIERNRLAAVATEEARQSAARSSSSANRELGRTVDVAGATRIVESIGGTVTSGLRSTQRQAQLYAAKLNGTHIGPVAKPGTSAHERGQAIDVAYGPGITAGSIRKAFADAGVTLRKVLDEPTQRVFHVEYGKAGPAGPSAATLAKRTESARVAVLRDENEFTSDVLQARRRLLDATARSAGSEEQRAALLIEEINAEADATNRKLGNDVKAGELTAAQAAQLTGINEATRQQRLQNVKIEAATRLVDRQYQARGEEDQSRVEVLRLQQGMAVTDVERERIGREILALEQQLRRATLERLRDTSPDAVQVQGAKDALGRLPALEQAETDSFEAGNVDPIEQYRQRLIGATADMDSALQGVAVRGLGEIEDGFVGLIDGTESFAGAVKSMTASVISDLARIAIQKAVLGALTGGASFLGFADGGLPGFADGGLPSGLIRGPGTGRSDSIIARVSNREYIVNAAATAAHLPLLEAINSNRLPAFANGGPVSPRLRAPRMPALSNPAARSNGGPSFPISVDARASNDPAAVEAAVYRGLAAATPTIIHLAKGGTMGELSRPVLPGGAG